MVCWTNNRTGYFSGWLIPSLGALLLVGCTPQSEFASTTECEAAVAIARATWEVEYYTSRANPSTRRTKRFASAQLVNRNGEPPTAAETGSDKQGIWWPELPPRPTDEDVDEQRRAAEKNDPPSLERRVEYMLHCQDGELTANAEIYQQVSQAIRAGEAIQVRHRLGKVVGTELPALAEGELPSEVAGSSPDDRQPSSVSKGVTAESGTFYVNPVNGNDAGVGTEAAPFKTISHAIAQAGPNSTIQLSPGTYSSATGERFPLQLKSGLTLLGNGANQGSGILIKGGGDFVSPTWARQNVIIRAADGAKVIGLTLSNANVRGSAVWVETGTPLIAQNTFRDNHREGVFVAASATPEIRNNRFEQNGGNGVAFTRNSGGLLSGNEIRSSGYGVTIGDRANPLLTNNQIADNRSGVVISGEARPVLRQNAIANNQQDGIVVTNNAQPTLQQNTLSRNGQYDLRNTTNRPLKVESGSLAGLKVEGAVQ